MLTEKKEIDRIMCNVNATLKFEGLTASRVATAANRRMLKGEITGEEARRMILNNYHIVGK